MSEEARPITLRKLEIRKTFIVWSNSIAMGYIALLVSSFFAPPEIMLVLIPKYFSLACKIASVVAIIIACMFYLLATTRLILDREEKILHVLPCILFVLFALAFGDIGFLM